MMGFLFFFFPAGHIHTTLSEKLLKYHTFFGKHNWRTEATDDHFENPYNLYYNSFPQEVLKYIIWNAIGSGFRKMGVQLSEVAHRVRAPYVPRAFESHTHRRGRVSEQCDWLFLFRKPYVTIFENNGYYDRHRINID